jgi:RNA polymerase sigma factor (sigma-70 family)
VRTVSVPLRSDAGPVRSKRLLALLGDERLVAHVRRGSEPAFEILYERHGAGILAFCRHMLGSREEAEDAVQQTFASAYSDLLRDERTIRVKPWLYTIARNRCLSILRARRDQVAAEVDVQVAGLEEQVERRSDLRQLLRDLRDLPEDQRAALLLSETGGLTHTQVAEVLGCQVHKVKALVFRARSGLMQRREARELSCNEVREQLANLRGGSLRRSHLRHHLRECPGCRTFRAEVKRQRALMAAALPVTPSMGLKASVLSAAGFGGGAGGGGAALTGGAAVSGALPAVAATAAKLAVVGALVGGGAVGGHAVLTGSAPEHGKVDSALEAPATPTPREAALGSGAHGGQSGLPRRRRDQAARNAPSRRALAPRRQDGTTVARGRRHAVEFRGRSQDWGSETGRRSPVRGGTDKRPTIEAVRQRGRSALPRSSREARAKGTGDSSPALEDSASGY